MPLGREEIDAGEEFDGEVFADFVWEEGDLRQREFRNCRFERVRLPGALLAGVTLEDCVFQRCDLTLAKIAGAAFRDVRFEHSKLMGVDWTDVRGLVFSVSFEECVLDLGTFSQRKMDGTSFRECQARETTFMGVDLSRADFSGTDLSGARFEDCILERADLSKARNYVIRPEKNRLRETLFSYEAALEVVEGLGIRVPDR